MAGLVAGAMNRGDFEKRVKDLLHEVRGSEGSVILFIDEMHTLLKDREDGVGGHAPDAATILKPALARGDLIVRSMMNSTKHITSLITTY